MTEEERKELEEMIEAYLDPEKFTEIVGAALLAMENEEKELAEALDIESEGINDIERTAIVDNVVDDYAENFWLYQEAVNNEFSTILVRERNEDFAQLMDDFRDGKIDRKDFWISVHEMIDELDDEVLEKYKVRLEKADKILEEIDEEVYYQHIIIAITPDKGEGAVTNLEQAAERMKEAKITIDEFGELRYQAKDEREKLEAEREFEEQQNEEEKELGTEQTNVQNAVRGLRDSMQGNLNEVGFASAPAAGANSDISKTV